MAISLMVFFELIILSLSSFIFLIILLVKNKISVKNKSVFMMGISIFIISIISAVFPTYNEQFFYVLYLVDIVLNIVIGLLFLIGVIKYDRNLVNFAFKIGIGVWVLLIICNFYGLFWNIDQEIKISPHEIFDILGLVLVIEKGYPLVSFLHTYIDVNYIGIFGSIIHLLLTIAEFLLGYVIFNKMK